MIVRPMEVKIPAGLDPSTIAMFIQIASQYESKLYVEVKEKKVNAKSIMGMMSLALGTGESVKVIANGNDEQAAIDSIEEYLSGKKQQG